MEPIKSLINAAYHASDKIEIAIIRFKLDTMLSIVSSNTAATALADKYALDAEHLLSWIKNAKYTEANDIITSSSIHKTLLDESHGISKGNKNFSFQWSISIIDDSTAICFLRDIKWRQTYSDQWSLAERVFNSSRSSIVITDSANKIIFVNKHFEEISGYSFHEVIGSDPGLFGSKKQSKHFYQEMWSTLSKEGFWSGVIWNVRKDGREYPEQKTIYTVKNSTGAITNYFSSGEISYTHKQTDHMIGTTRAQHDDIISRECFIERIKQSKHYGEDAIAIYHIGIDNMSQANQICGMAFGDHILNRLSERLLETFLPKGIICRSVGDEFIVATEVINTPEQADKVGSLLLSSLGAHISHEGLEWEITASIGVSFTAVGTDIWKSVEQANIAMHHAKEQGGNCIQFYDAEAQLEAKKNILLAQALKYAIKNNELYLNYQPLYQLDGHEIVSVEALLRWRSEEFGMVSPDVFIPIAEKDDLISEIGLWVFESVCQQIVAWGDAFKGSVAINLSASQIQASRLPAQLLSLISQYQVPIERIELEITETAMIADKNSAASVVSLLKMYGFQISIDDFGTGYSSLSYLTKFNANKLKVDRSFIDSMISDTGSFIVTKAIIGLAKSLGLKVVAEGIETEQQLKELVKLGCDFGQGYLLSRPVDPHRIIELMKPHEACLA